MALSADKPTKLAVGPGLDYPMLASTVIYEGSMLGLSSGYARALVAGDVFIGHANEARTETTAVNGGDDINIQSTEPYSLEVPVTGSTAVTDTGDNVYASDDATLTLTAGSNSPVGKIRRWLSGTTCEVTFDPLGSSQGELELTGPIQQDLSGTGYSLNLISVTSDTASGNTRGWRVNCTTSPAIAHGDLQCVHGYLTLGAGASLAANAAVYPLSAWIDIPDTTTTSTGNIIAGIRVIFDPNNNDLSVLAGGGESALFYGQTWASSGSIDEGIRIVAGAGSTIGNALSMGGSGTFSRIIDLTEWGANAEMTFISMGLKDAQNRSVQAYYGDLTTRAAIRAAKGDLIGMGSVYTSTNGEVFIKVAGAAADTDWEVVSHAAADAG